MAEFDEDAKKLIWDAVHQLPATEVRVFSHPGANTRIASGIDALLTTPEVLSEFFRRRAMVNREFGPLSAREAYIRSLTPAELADLVWRQLFLDHAPLSEPLRIVLTTLGMFGLDVATGDLRVLREQYDQIPAGEKVERIIALANIDFALYAADAWPDDPSQYVADAGAVFTPTAASPQPADLFRPVLYLSRLFSDWKEGARRLRLRGFGLKAKVDQFAPLEFRRFLSGEAARLAPVALGLDWPAGGAHPDDECIGRLVREAVLPFCRERALPFFLESGEERIERLECLWQEHPEVRFLLFPGREDQFASAVIAAAAARNVLLAGPDQPLSFPRIMDGFHGLRLEGLGGAFHAFHSSAGAVEELVGCWAHGRWTLGKALLRHYSELWRTGWRFTEESVRREVGLLLGGNVRRFIGVER